MKAPLEMVCAVVHVATQAPGVLHQVVLDPQKVKVTDAGKLIRLGDYPGDECAGWQMLQNIDVIVELGRASYDAEARKVTVVP